MRPRLSVVILTLNEAHNITACMESLARQVDRDFEVILIDAASDDGTVQVARQLTRSLALPVRIVEASERLPIGEARNLGVALARSDRVAFVSADAELAPEWTARALQGLDEVDMVFSAQVHAPHKWTVGASVRGLRYHFPDRPLRDEAAYPFASNVAAAYRKEVLLGAPFEAGTDAAEDLLLARVALDTGHTALYDPDMIVLHHDVETVGQEWRKVTREGLGCGRYAGTLGIMPGWLLWGGALAAAVLAPRRGMLGSATLLGIAYLPAMLRAKRRAKAMPSVAVAKGVAVTPWFDGAFVARYVQGLRQRAGATRAPSAQTAARTEAATVAALHHKLGMDPAPNGPGQGADAQ